MQSSERWIIGALFTIALLTFFFPLVTLQVPILGNQDLSGYDLIERSKEFDQTLDAVKSEKLGETGSERSQQTPLEANSLDRLASMPFSVRTLPFIPIEVIVSFVSALIALFFSFGSIRSVFTKVISTLGCVAAITAVLHLSIANSDLHTWFREQMKVDSSTLANNPFAGLAQEMVNLVANSFQLKPGVGLYVLAASLSLATIFLYSRVLSATQLAEPEMPSFEQARRLRVVAFMAFSAVLLIVAAAVLFHTPQVDKRTPNSVLTESTTTLGNSAITNSGGTQAAQTGGQNDSVIISYPNITYTLPVQGIHGIDFRNKKYPLDEPIQLKDGRDEEPFGIGMVDVTELKNVWYFDSQGGDDQHALVYLEENSGKVASGFLILFGLVNDHPVAREKIVLNMYATGTGVSFNKTSGVLVVKSRSNDDSPMCCPQHLDVVTFQWNGTLLEKTMTQVVGIQQ